MQCSLKLLLLKCVFLGSDVKAKLSSSPVRHFICVGFIICIARFWLSR